MANKDILYVDDNVDLLWTAEMFLSGEFPDYTVHTAVDAEEVCRMLDDGSLDLEGLAVVCTDGDLGTSTGWDLMESLRDRGYKGPAVYTGASMLPEDKVHLYSACSKKAGPDLIEVLSDYV